MSWTYTIHHWMLSKQIPAKSGKSAGNHENSGESRKNRGKSGKSWKSGRKSGKPILKSVRQCYHEDMIFDIYIIVKNLQKGQFHHE